MSLRVLLTAAALVACTDPDATGPRLVDQDIFAVQIIPGAALMTSDAAQVRGARINGHFLELELRFGGGCRPHLFGAYTDGTQGLSLPPFVTVILAHDANGDACEALVTRTVAADLRPLRPAVGSGDLIIHLVDPSGARVQSDLLYRF